MRLRLVVIIIMFCSTLIPTLSLSRGALADQEKILIESKPVIISGTIYDHLYLVYVDSQGKQTVIRGGPRYTLAKPLSIGDIEVEINLPLADSEDARGTDTPAERGSREVNLGDRVAKDVWDLMLQHAQMIAQAHVTYTLPPNARNSNTTILSVMNAAGISVADNLPLNRQAGDFPGLGRNLGVVVRLQGTPRNDVMNGDTTDDVFTTGGGTDTVSGGAGYDRYILSTTYDSTTNTSSHDGRLIVIDSDKRGALVGIGGSIEGHAYGVYTSGQLDYYVLITEATQASFVTRYALRMDGADLLVWVMRQVAGGSWQPDFTRPADFVVNSWTQGQFGIFLFDCRSSNPNNPSGSRTCYEFIEGTSAGETFVFDDEAQVLRADGFQATVGAADTATMGGGNDVAQMGPGNDTADGGPGKDFLVGDAGDDVMRGGDGDDTMNQNAGNNTLIAAEASDIDEMYGDAGNDVLSAYGGFKYLYGGAGDDTLIIKTATFTPPSGLPNPNRLEGSDGSNTFEVDRARATLTFEGYEFQQYKVTKATLEQGYDVVIENVNPGDPGPILNGSLQINGRKIINASAEREYTLSYSPLTRQLSITLRSAPVASDGATLTAASGVIVVQGFYDGALGIANVPNAPPAPWLQPVAALGESVYLPMVVR